MQITLPQPDEFSAGHLGRLLRLNALTPKKSAAHPVLAAAEQKSKMARYSPLHAIAALVDMEATAYARQHSLLPFHSFAFPTDQTGHHTQWQPGHYQRFGMSARNPHAVLCPMCIADDERKKERGYSYWRREHQIFGMRWCNHHGVLLRHVPSSCGFAFFRMPHECLSRATPYTVSAAHGEPDIMLMRYQQMAKLMTEHGAPRSLSNMRDHIAKQAQAQGLALSRCANGARLTSDRAFRLFPREWLSEVISGTEKKQSGLRFPPLDNASKPLRKGMIGTPGMTIALASLFDDPESAIHTICSAEPPTSVWEDGEQQVSQFKRRAAPDPFSSQKIARAFVKCQGNVEAMAAIFDCSPKKIHSLLKSRRNHVLPALRALPEGMAAIDFCLGQSLAEVMESHVVPLGTLEALLRYLPNHLWMGRSVSKAKGRRPSSS